MNIGGSVMTGHPTVARNLALLGMVPNQALAAQAAWWIDPINGHDSASGKTQQTALKTRTEFARRTFGMSLKQAITVNITSSLNAGDDGQPLIFGDQTQGWSVNYVGTSTVSTRTITAYTNNTPSSNTVGLMTVNGAALAFPVGTVIERTNGTMRCVVIIDHGGNQVTISPPISNLNVTGNFTNGDQVNVFTAEPNIRDVQMMGGFNTYKYLNATKWLQQWGRNDQTSCTGGVSGTGGAYNPINCFTGERFTENTNNGLTLSGTNVNIYGGYHGMVLVGGGSCVVKASTCFCMIQLESGASLDTAGNTPGGGSNFADVMINTTTAAPNAPIDHISFSNTTMTFDGFVYGSSTSTTNLVSCQGNRSRTTFRQTPTVTTAVNAFFAIDNITEALSRLSSIELADTRDNKIMGAAGPQTTIDRLQIVKAARGIITEVFDPLNGVGATAMVSGVVYYMGVGLRAGDVITNIDVSVISSAGTSITASRVGLYDKAGNLLAESADLGTAWQSLGVKTHPLTAPFTITKTDMYFVAIFATSTGTMPTMTRGGSGALYTYGGAAGTVNSSWQVQTGVATNLPNPAVFAVPGTTHSVYWAALS